MTQPRYDYHYSEQMKRFLDQVIRAFSGWQWATGRMIDGKPELRVVPCRMATTNRMVAAMLRNNSENTLLTVPLITVYRAGIARNTTQENNSTLTSRVHVAERAIDPDTGLYTAARGQGYTIERITPMPLEMTIQIDIWTSNTNQKDQLLEQMLPVVGREFDIQNSDNAVDWTALSLMKCTDIQYSSRSIPIGTEDEIDVATLTYTLPFWINPPAKITRQVLINKVVTNVETGTGTQDEGPFTQMVVTPKDYRIAIERGSVTLLGTDNQPKEWSDFATLYRMTINDGVTELRLRKSDAEDAPEIVGQIYQTPDGTKVDWQVDIDTLPANTLPPVDAIIRPLTISPNAGLPAPQEGQRYLIFDDIGDTQAWGTVNARANDIIQYRNGMWTVMTRASSITSAYVVNLRSGTQLHWTGSDWEKAIDGVYMPSHWRLIA